MSLQVLPEMSSQTQGETRGPIVEVGKEMDCWGSSEVDLRVLRSISTDHMRYTVLSVPMWLAESHVGAEDPRSYNPEYQRQSGVSFSPTSGYLPRCENDLISLPRYF